MTQELLDFFNGDELAADVWEKKYKFKNEKTPVDSFKRYCKEIATKEIERTRPISLYKEIDDCLSEHGKIRWCKVLNNSHCAADKAQELMENYFSSFINFDNIILGGSLLSTIGNHNTYSSLSNCFVLGRPHDSYAGINQKTMEMCEVMKRRMGSGIDISSLRPDGAIVHNQSSESCGPILFAERYSYISSEIAQRGRRGALLISIQIKHPNAIEFAKSKQDLKKLTGANISIIVDNEFMKAVENNDYYYQQFPINIPLKAFKFNPLEQDVVNELKEVPYFYNGKEEIGYIKIIQARKAWEEIIHCAWKSAEPGIIFYDNWIEGGTDSVYEQYRPITANPCSELPMQAYDSCRLASINLFSFVQNPFTKEAQFNFDRFYQVAYEQICILDNIIDLEADYIERIIDKINKDKDEPNDLKQQTITLWRKILSEGQSGRRLGAGFTALGDTIAALGLKYNNSIDTMHFLEELFKTKMRAELDATIDLAVLYGPFCHYNIEKEYEISGVLHPRNKIFETINNEFSEQLSRMYKYGRRNVSWSTAAPTGSLSILSQTTSGIEPLFLPYYKRRKKCTKHDERVDYIDPADGQKFTEYIVIHPKYKLWLEKTHNINSSILSETQLDKIFETSPWFGSCANDINWKSRINIQAIVQKYTTHSISSTINLPSNIDESVISKIYFESWKKGLKGNTIYRDGSRGGVMVSTNNKKEDNDNFEENRAPKRPNRLPAFYHTLRYRDKVYSVIIGLLDNKPYEVFIASGLDGMPENLDEFEDKIKGEIVKEAKNWYNFECTGFILKDIADAESEERLTSLMLSMALRHRTPLKYVIKTLEKSRPIAGSFTHRLIKILYQYMNDNDYDDKEKCPECSGKLKHENGCVICNQCGWSKCG